MLFIARCAKTEVSYSRSWQLPILTAEKCFLRMLTKHFETMFLCLMLSGSFSSIIFQPGRRTPSKILRLGMLCQRFKTGLALNGHSKSPPLLSWSKKKEIGSRLICSIGKRENDSIIYHLCVTHPPSRLDLGVRTSSRVFRSVCRRSRVVGGVRARSRVVRGVLVFVVGFGRRWNENEKVFLRCLYHRILRRTMVLIFRAIVRDPWRRSI